MDRVRLFARLGEELTVIALCRHAQARILIREGQASWNDDKLVLHDALAVPTGARPDIADLYKQAERSFRYSQEGIERGETLLNLVESIPWPDGTKISTRWSREESWLYVSVRGPRINDHALVISNYLTESGSSYRVRTVTPSEFRHQDQEKEGGSTWGATQEQPSLDYYVSIRGSHDCKTTYMGPRWWHSSPEDAENMHPAWVPMIPDDVPDDKLPARLLYVRREEGDLLKVLEQHLLVLAKLAHTPEVLFYPLWPSGGHIIVDQRDDDRAPDGTGKSITERLQEQRQRRITEFLGETVSFEPMVSKLMARGVSETDICNIVSKMTCLNKTEVEILIEALGLTQ